MLSKEERRTAFRIHFTGKQEIAVFPFGLMNPLRKHCSMLHSAFCRDGRFAMGHQTDQLFPRIPECVEWHAIDGAVKMGRIDVQNHVDSLFPEIPDQRHANFVFGLKKRIAFRVFDEADPFSFPDGHQFNLQTLAPRVRTGIFNAAFRAAYRRCGLRFAFRPAPGRARR